MANSREVTHHTGGIRCYLHLWLQAGTVGWGLSLAGTLQCNLLCAFSLLTCGLLWRCQNEAQFRRWSKKVVERFHLPIGSPSK
jgi:hypothetical protein